MISIFVFYSTDRKMQLEQMIRHMEEMVIYNECQKILIVDGEETNTTPQDWEILYLSRKNDVFCWADMWEKGVENSKNDIMLYLDSDRILPNHYLETLTNKIEDNQFLFCQDLFAFHHEVDDGIIKKYMALTPQQIKKNYDQYKYEIFYDPRFRLPCLGPGKGVMSGNAAFTKNTYLKSGGVPDFYVGHGAWADNAFHHQCWDLGIEMINLGCLELHLHHMKSIPARILSRRELEILSLINYIYYCNVYNLKLDRAKYLSDYLELKPSFTEYVNILIAEEKIKDLVIDLNKNGFTEAFFSSF